MTRTTDNLQSVRGLGLLGDLRLLVILFISFRLMLVMVYQPLVIDDVERGLSAQGDRLYHFELAALTDDGDWPFVDWWSEFPPVWYWLTTAVYQLQGENVNYGAWTMTLGLLMLAWLTSDGRGPRHVPAM